MELKCRAVIIAKRIERFVLSAHRPGTPQPSG